MKITTKWKMEALDQTLPQTNVQAGVRSTFQPLAVSSPPTRSVSLRLAILSLLFALAGNLAFSADYVFVVDTSGSMTGKISSKDPRIRITTVQEAMRSYLNAIPPDTRATFISFNTGIASEKEMVLRSDADRQEAMQWVNQLATEASQNGDTYLWSTLRRALKIAANYSKQNPEQTVVVRVLTDGQDTEKDLKGRNRWTLDQVLSEFPDLDGRAIRANLVLLGDLEIPFRTKHLGFDIVRDPHFSFIFPPVIEWAPKPSQVEKDITFFDNSRSNYEFWEWRVDGALLGQKRSVTHRFRAPGEHTVQLVVTGTGGMKDAATVRVNVIEAEKEESMIPSFVFAPSSPEPGQTVKFLGRSSGKPDAYSWQIGGQEFATTADAERSFPQEGTTEVKFIVRDAKGNLMEKSHVVSVVEPDVSVEFKALAEAGHEQVIQFGNETQGRVASFEWDFGDGQKSTERNPAHTYRNEGTALLLVNVTLRATTPTGKTRASQPHPIKVFPRVRPEEIPPPKAAFRVLGDRLKMGALIQFIDDSTGPIESQEWDFNREGRSVGKNPEFRFETLGSKTVRLTVRGKGGANSASQTILIPEPDKNIDVHWIDQYGQNTVPPKEIDFGEIPMQHIKNNQYPRPVGTEFEIVLPQELPAGSGAVVALEGKLAAFSVVRILPGAEKVGPVLGNGSDPISLRADDQFAIIVSFRGRGDDVQSEPSRRRHQAIAENRADLFGSG